MSDRAELQRRLIRECERLRAEGAALALRNARWCAVPWNARAPFTPWPTKSSDDTAPYFDRKMASAADD